MSRAGLPSTRRTQIYYSKCREETLNMDSEHFIWGESEKDGANQCDKGKAQTLLSGAQWHQKEKRQWTQSEKQEISFKRYKEHFYSEGGLTSGQMDQTGYGVPILWDAQSPPEHGLSNLLWLTLLWVQSWIGGLQKCPPTSSMLWLFTIGRFLFDFFKERLILLIFRFAYAASKKHLFHGSDL